MRTVTLHYLISSKFLHLEQYLTHVVGTQQIFVLHPQARTFLGWGISLSPIPNISVSLLLSQLLTCWATPIRFNRPAIVFASSHSLDSTPANGFHYLGTTYLPAAALAVPLLSPGLLPNLITAISPTQLRWSFCYFENCLSAAAFTVSSDPCCQLYCQGGTSHPPATAATPADASLLHVTSSAVLPMIRIKSKQERPLKRNLLDLLLQYQSAV
jgi:hypothetical protein